MSDAEKARILDWLLSASQARADRPASLHKHIDKNNASALMVFMAWGDPEHVLTEMKKAADANSSKLEKEAS